ncbi:hypothetical protein GCM10010954_23940 [Halobacillus andaensis]|uniref:XRE family transcriptional regulator n=1 Tax=Halobacillus andaensis TaxID=1176239 RepID=A0A917B5V4_HALAA|nr:hypothetical protein [Halobacillus andaensis]MBP2006016.1 putative XRE-type DNA-binding protein [Halobacillus andaensis]GGF24271.1 hypothetical protein GCM10010954_23940 [Halobacillus andaensis]
MKNKDIREAISKAGLRHWQVAEAYGIHEGNFSRLLRKELSPDQKEKVFLVIQKLK